MPEGAVPGVPGQTAVVSQPNTTESSTQSDVSRETDVSEVKEPQASQKEPQKSTEKVAETKKEEPKYYERKVNGQVRRYTIDQLLAKVGKEEAADEKFQAAAQAIKKVQEYENKLKSNPMGAFVERAREMGFSDAQIRNSIEQHYKQAYIDPDLMTEEQKAIAERDRKIQEYEAREKERADQEAALKQEAEDRQVREQIQKDIIDTIDKHGLPRNRFTAARLAFWMKQNHLRGYDAPPEVLVEQVKEERTEILRSFFNDEVSADKVVELLGEGIVKKIRLYDLERIKKRLGGQTEIETPSNGTTRAHGKENVPMSKVDDYFNELRRSKR